MSAYGTLVAALSVPFDSLGSANLCATIAMLVLLLLNGALEARHTVGLKMHVPAKQLQEVVACLPSERSPTVSTLASQEWVAVETVIDEATVRVIIPRLKSLGAEGIVEYPLNKVVH